MSVAVPVPALGLLTYRVPPGQAMPLPGARVVVPLGPRKLTGVAVGEVSAADTAYKLKDIVQLLDDGAFVPPDVVKLTQWVSEYYLAGPGAALAAALPPYGLTSKVDRFKTVRVVALTAAGLDAADRLVAHPRCAGDDAAVDGPTLGTKQKQAVQLLRASPDGLSVPDLAERGIAAASVTRLEALGYVTIRHDRVDRDPFEHAVGAHTPDAGGARRPLTDEQQAAMAQLTPLAAARTFRVALVHGVTGSGKTEVYLHAIADCLRRGKQALVLVPEIGLTPQTLARFRQRLGVPVLALHSGLNDNERARGWAAFARGEARVAVGTRSAVFTPLPHAGLIIVDEEHDASYKQQDGMRYHARDFALVRGKALDVPVILGSATPSLESLHNARSGRYAHLRLTLRAGDAKPPSVRVQDLRKRPLEAGLSRDTIAAITGALEAGGQVLVFKNRRGYAPVLMCHDCGWSAQCKRCDSPMTVHGAGRRLQCHHCGARQAVPPACPDCGGLALQPQGIGTERIEEMLTEKFNNVPVLRIDRGTTQRRDALAGLLEKLGDRPGILVGTQILAKGHDLPHLTLVVVVGVDEGLFSSDFRAGEKLAQQLIQVAGRAGRAHKPGQVWLQTHHPDHPLLNTLINGGYHAFAESELEQRQAAGFPPFAHLALLRAEAKHVDAANAFLHAAKSVFSASVPPHSGRMCREATDEVTKQPTATVPPSTVSPVEIQGPLPAPMSRRAGMHRMQLLLSAPNRRVLHALLDAALPAIHELPEARKVRWSLDVDPLDLY